MVLGIKNKATSIAMVTLLLISMFVVLVSVQSGDKLIDANTDLMQTARTLFESLIPTLQPVKAELLQVLNTISLANITPCTSPCTNPWDIVVNPVTNRIYVTKEGGDTVAVIEGNTGSPTQETVRAVVAVGSTPRGLAVNPITNKVYVADSGTTTVSVIDGGTNTLVKTISLSGITTTHGVAVDAATNKVYVSRTGGTVSVIDGATDTEVGTITTGGRVSAGIAFNPFTKMLYVAHRASNNVSVIDVASGTEVAIINVGSTPLEIAVNPITKRIYVTNSGTNTVSVIDGDPASPTVNTVIATIGLPSSPFGVTVHPYVDRVYVSWGTSTASRVSVIDGRPYSPTENAVLTTITPGNTPRGLAVLPQFARLYVANQVSNDISSIEIFPPFIFHPALNNDGNFVEVQVQGEPGSFIRVRIIDSALTADGTFRTFFDRRFTASEGDPPVERGQFRAAGGLGTVFVDVGGNAKYCIVINGVQFCPRVGSIFDSPDPFSPNNDGVNDVTRIFFRSSQSGTHSIDIKDSAGTTVNTLTGTTREDRLMSTIWDGKDSSNAIVPDGPYKYFITVTRPFDGITRFPPSDGDGTVTVDTVVPDTTIASAMDGNGLTVTSGGSTVSDSITFTFTGTDNIGVAGFECSLDGAAFSSCTSPLSFSGMVVNGHALQVRAVDTAGNMDPTPASFTWTILTPAEATQNLVSQVQSLVPPLNNGQVNSFTAKLNAVLNSINAGNVNDACGNLDDFIDQVNALTKPPAQKPLTQAQATALINQANAIKAAIGCP